MDAQPLRSREIEETCPQESMPKREISILIVIIIVPSLRLLESGSVHLERVWAHPTLCGVCQGGVRIVAIPPRLLPEGPQDIFHKI